MDAVVMCAGRGRRLMPLTENKPKSMVEIKGKPIIGWLIDILKSLNIDTIYIITGYKEGTLKSYLKYNYEDSNIIFVHQKELTGTADAINLIKNKIKGEFLVLSGDTIFPKMELELIMGKVNSILFTEKQNRLYEYGTLDIGGPLDGNGEWRLKFINEKTTRPTSYHINCGAYHFDERVFKYINKTDYDHRYNERIITNTINLMIDDGIPFSAFWTNDLYEISYFEDIERVENSL